MPMILPKPMHVMTATAPRLRARRIPCAVFHIVCRLALLAPLLAAAQNPLAALPGMSKAPQSASAAASAPLSDEEQRARLQKQLEEVRALAADLEKGPPANIGSAELDLADRRLAKWALVLEAQLRSLASMEQARAERDAAVAAGSTWQGFEEEPPYSILRVDELAQHIEALTTSLSVAGARRKVDERQLERLQEDAQRAAEARRRAEDAARAKPEDNRLAWRASVAAWATHAAEMATVAVTMESELARVRAQADEARLALLRRQLQSARAQVRFDETDLRMVHEQAAARQKELDKNAAAALANAERLAGEAAAASRALEGLRKADPASAQLPVAEARLKALSAAVETARREAEVNRALSTLSAALVDAWEQRFEAVNSESAKRRNAASLALQEMTRGADVWKSFAGAQISAARVEQAEQRVARQHAVGDPELERHEAARYESLSQRVLVLQQLADEVGRNQRTLEYWLRDLGEGEQQRPWMERLEAAGVTVAAAARAIWTFELFSFEDSIEVQGQTIRTTRGVTVGKSIGSVLIFVLGYWVASALARRMERTLIKRYQVDVQQARTVRRWLMTAVAFVLLLITLNLAQIPLTVFAFLGGALAIGVGFGTQTIIKNFISGLIVLLERQVRVGDSIEVDGFSGTVTEVNLRSSTIKGFDGIDAIVPNSTLIEGRVVNWMMGDSKLRRVVRVGVAYGAPLRKAAHLIRECADRHGQVLDKPEPQVLLEDFGDNALVFALFVWIDLKSGAVGSVVLSDLRFMIESALSEAGIAIAYPQRDVHLDISRPVQVQVIQPPPSGAAA